MRAITLFFIFSIIALLALSFSYAQFSETLRIGGPGTPGNTVTTGDIDPGIYMWFGLGGRYAKIKPLFAYYDPPVQSISFSVENAYPGYGSQVVMPPHRMMCVVFVKNDGSVPVKVQSIDWDVPDYVEVSYWGGDIPEDMLNDIIQAINESEGIPEDKKELMISMLNQSNCMHEGRIILPYEWDVPIFLKWDALVFNWHFKEDAEIPENASFTGTCTITFTQFNAQ